MQNTVEITWNSLDIEPPMDGHTAVLVATGISSEPKIALAGRCEDGSLGFVDGGRLVVPDPIAWALLPQPPNGLSSMDSRS